MKGNEEDITEYIPRQKEFWNKLENHFNKNKIKKSKKRIGINSK